MFLTHLPTPERALTPVRERALRCTTAILCGLDTSGSANMSGEIPRGHATSLQHDGVLQRWCEVQQDVEDYFRKTLPEVFSPAHSPRRVYLCHV